MIRPGGLLKSSKKLWSCSFERLFCSSKPSLLDAASLKEYIRTEISESKETFIQDEVTLKALADCSKLEALYLTSSSFDSPLTEKPSEEARILLKDVLEDSRVHLTKSLLHSFFTLKPAPSTQSSIMALESFFKKNSREAIPESLAMIPFRRAAYNGEYEEAFKLIDLSVAGPQFQNQITKRLRKYFGYWVGTVSSVLVGVETLLQSGLVGSWESTGMVHGMVATYLSATTLFALLATSSKSSGSGETLEWIQGTTMSYRYRHGAELKMSSTLADLNRLLPENQNECSLAMSKELAKRSIRVVEMDQETMMKEYWARSGSGFEWIEPDQDPADLLWREKVNAEKAKRIGSPFSRAGSQEYGWAEDTVPRSLPHASLINTGPKALPGEQM
jgi:hypothetical protein